MKILVVDFFDTYLKEHFDALRTFIKDGNMIVSMYNAITSEPVAICDKEFIAAHDHENRFWVELFDGLDGELPFVNFSLESGYPTKLRKVQKDGHTEIVEEPFEGFSFNPGSSVSRIQLLFRFMQKCYPNVTLKDMFFAFQDTTLFEQAKAVNGHVAQISSKNTLDTILQSKFMDSHSKKKTFEVREVLPYAYFEDLQKKDVLFATVEGVLQGVGKSGVEANIAEAKREITSFLSNGNLLVLFTSSYERPFVQYKRLYDLLAPVLPTCATSIFLFSRDVAGLQLGSQNHFYISMKEEEKEQLRDMFGKHTCFLPFGWHETKDEVLDAFFSLLMQSGVRISHMYAVGEDLMQDRRLLERIQEKGGTVGMVIPGEDPEQTVVDSIKNYEHFDKDCIKDLPELLSIRVESFAQFTKENMQMDKGTNVHL